MTSESLIDRSSLHVRKMFDSIAFRYDRANTALSFGIHHLWRKELMKRAPLVPEGSALDLCTGTGDLLPYLHKRYRTVVGADFSFKMLRAGKLNGPSSRVNSQVIQASAMQLPFANETFDLVTVSFGVRNFEDLNIGLKEINRVLKKGGTLLVLEFGQPRSKLFAYLFNFYSKHIMPIIGGWLTGNRAAYTYLPTTSATFPCDRAFAEILEKNGYRTDTIRALSFGIAYAYRAYR